MSVEAAPLYLERQVKPWRANNATRIALVALSWHNEIRMDSIAGSVSANGRNINLAMRTEF